MSKLSVFIFDFQNSHFKTIRFNEDRQVYTIGIASPLLDVCHALYAEADALPDHDLDMVAVVRALERRTAAIGGPDSSICSR